MNNAVRSRMGFPELTAMLGGFDPGMPWRWLECRNQLSVFRFGILLIESTILLMWKIDATKAILTSGAVRKKKTVTAVFAELAALKSVAVFAHCAVITEFRPWTVGTVNAIACSHTVLTVHTVFGICRVKDQVTILSACVVIAVITIYYLVKRKRTMWNRVTDCLQLGEEWFSFLEFLTID